MKKQVKLFFYFTEKKCKKVFLFSLHKERKREKQPCQCKKIFFIKEHHFIKKILPKLIHSNNRIYITFIFLISEKRV